ncbi:hypothetical protein BDP67DRAFT_63565 [Colletotrichum lupini]|nr:hypothetical protein BDP67DRAFT_63565 [Colletotrichum lupini]
MYLMEAGTFLRIFCMGHRLSQSSTRVNPQPTIQPSICHPPAHLGTLSSQSRMRPKVSPLFQSSLVSAPSKHPSARELHRCQKSLQLSHIRLRFLLGLWRSSRYLFGTPSPPSPSRLSLELPAQRNLRTSTHENNSTCVLDTGCAAAPRGESPEIGATTHDRPPVRLWPSPSPYVSGCFSRPLLPSISASASLASALLYLPLPHTLSHSIHNSEP